MSGDEENKAEPEILPPTEALAMAIEILDQVVASMSAFDFVDQERAKGRTATMARLKASLAWAKENGCDTSKAAAAVIPADPDKTIQP